MVDIMKRLVRKPAWSEGSASADIDSKLERTVIEAVRVGKLSVQAKDELRTLTRERAEILSKPPKKVVEAS